MLSASAYFDMVIDTMYACMQPLIFYLYLVCVCVCVQPFSSIINFFEFISSNNRCTEILSLDYMLLDSTIPTELGALINLGKRYDVYVSQI